MKEIYKNLGFLESLEIKLEILEVLETCVGILEGLLIVTCALWTEPNLEFYSSSVRLFVLFV